MSRANGNGYAGDKLIEIRNLVKTYVVGSEKVNALRGVNLDIGKNEYWETANSPIFAIAASALSFRPSICLRAPRRCTMSNYP